MEQHIDIVILWVDGEDPSWIDKKTFWQKKYGILDESPERYRNWENLQYLFRGIEKFAPWVNHVFLVTDNQKPEWLDENYDKVTIINHTEIIDEKYLPTYNSNAIELNLHKIDKLSEEFIYFNDDFFLIDKTEAEDFFVNGIPKDTAASSLLVPRKNQQIYNYIFNNLSIINDRFSKYDTIKASPSKWINFKYGLEIFKTILLLPWPGFSGFYDPHICASYNKKTFKEVWSKYEVELLETTKSKFRQANNYSPALMKYWQLASNRFIPRVKGFGKLFNLTDMNSTKTCVKHIVKQKSQVVCINDNESLEDFLYSKVEVNKAFDILLPEKSKFEK